MKLDLERTIVAVSSPLAPAKRAIVRLSGQATSAILHRLIVADTPRHASAKDSLLSARSATYARLPCEVGLQGRCLPMGVYYWPSARSFTGEPCAELHLLGSIPLVEALTEHLATLGAAPAERGEFTLRSFLAGKIDLTQAEAVLGVIEAQSPAQLDLALSQLAGNLSEPVRALSRHLIELIAHLEAGLDFIEEDIEFITPEQLAEQLTKIHARLLALAAQLRSRGTRTRTPQLVLVGLPNAGKSSLFNALLSTERAIVSDVAGTTRDAISQTTEVGELIVELVDTAGLEEMAEASPRGLAQGVLRQRLESADAILFCVDASQPPSADWLIGQHAKLADLAVPLVVVGTKADLLSPEMQAAWQQLTESLKTGLLKTGLLEIVSAADEQRQTSTCVVTVPKLVSVREPAGLAALQQQLAAALSNTARDLHSDAMHRAMVRSRNSLELAIAALERGLELIAGVEGEELVATELRIALDDLAAVIGEVHNEDILGEIFSRFCIGK